MCSNADLSARFLVFLPERVMSITRHRSLAERGGRKVFFRDKGLAHTQKGKKKETNVRTTRYSRIFKKKRVFEHIKLPSKLLDYFYEVIKATSINACWASYLEEGAIWWRKCQSWKDCPGEWAQLCTDNVNFCTRSRPYQRAASRPSGPERFFLER